MRIKLNKKKERRRLVSMARSCKRSTVERWIKFNCERKSIELENQKHSQGSITQKRTEQAYK